MFANGSDYEEFLNSNCFKCPLYVHYEEATDDKSVCNIEERIVLASLGAEEEFPYEWLDKNERIPTYSCRKFKGKEKCSNLKPVENSNENTATLNKILSKDLFV